MDSLSHLLALLAPRCEVNLHCRFGGRWQAGHQQMRSGVVPWHVVLRGEGRLNVGGQTHHLRAGDVVLLPHGSPHLMESLVEWGQVLPVAHRFNGTVTEMRAGPAEGALEMLCGEFYFGPHVSWLFSEASTLIHLHTDAREDCPELDALLNILVRESLAQRPGEYGCPRVFITGHLCPSFCPRLSPDAAGVAVAVANGAGRPAAAPGASDQPRGHCRTLRLSVAGVLLEALQNALWRDAGRVATGLAPRVSRR